LRNEVLIATKVTRCYCCLVDTLIYTSTDQLLPQSLEDIEISHLKQAIFQLQRCKGAY